MTANQIQLLHIAVKDRRLEDAQYRMLLKNVAKVESSTQLTNATFERVMATLEGMGFRHAGKGETYWRDKVNHASEFASARAVHYIQELAAQCRYNLPALCLRFSQDRTDQPDQLTPREAWQLTEMLKSAVARGTGNPARVPEPNLFGDAGDVRPPPAPARDTGGCSRTPARDGFDDALSEEEIPF